MLDSTDLSRSQLAWLALEILSQLEAEAAERNVPSLQTVEMIVGGPEALAHGLWASLEWLRHRRPTEDGLGY